MQLNLKDGREVEEAYADPKALEQIGKLDALEGVWVQAMAPEGVEVLVGVTEDPLGR